MDALAAVPWPYSSATPSMPRAVGLCRDAAMSLHDYKNGETFWPKYALLTHAIELALKAFARHSATIGKQSLQAPRQHDLSGWYQLALQYGLPNKPGLADNIDLLN